MVYVVQFLLALIQDVLRNPPQTAEDERQALLKIQRDISDELARRSMQP